mgnify:CR=1 FL=1
MIVDLPRGPLVVASLGKNALIGDIGILCDVPRTATIKALSRVTTLKIAKDLFLRMVIDFPTMGLEDDARARPPVGEDDVADLREARSRIPQ